MSIRKLICLGMVAVITGTVVPAITPLAQKVQAEESETTDSGNFQISSDGTLQKYLGKDTNVTIPNGVKTIGSFAFQDCSNVTSVTIPDSVKAIKMGAFQGCSSLADITIPGSVSSLSEQAFLRCSSLTSITIPNGVKSISPKVFWDCSSLKSVVIPDNVNYIGEAAFRGCSSLENITIPGNATYIGQYAFEGCSSLKSVTIPDSVTLIYSSTFKNCDSLKSMTIPGSVKRILDSAFESCDSLESVVISEGVLTIKNSVFEGCIALKSVTIPDSVTSLGSSVFKNCDGLKTVTIPGNIGNIGNSAFESCDSLESVVLSDRVGMIGASAFQDCINLKNVTLPNKLGSIGAAAFYGCKNLKSITIPKSVALSHIGGLDNLGNWKGIINRGSRTVIYCESGSGAERYAKKMGHKYQLIDKISCNKKTYNVAYGNAPFKIKASSKEKLTFTSSDKKIVTVGESSGKVTIKGCGIATINLKTGKDTVKVTVKVIPKKQKIKTIKSTKGKNLTVKWEKDKMASGCQIQLSTAKNFKKIAKQKKLSSKCTYTFTELKPGKKYYVRVRSYKKSGKSTLYGAWSTVKQSKNIRK